MSTCPTAVPYPRRRTTSSISHSSHCPWPASASPFALFQFIGHFGNDGKNPSARGSRVTHIWFFKFLRFKECSKWTFGNLSTRGKHSNHKIDCSQCIRVQRCLNRSHRGTLVCFPCTVFHSCRICRCKSKWFSFYSVWYQLFCRNGPALYFQFLQTFFLLHLFWVQMTSPNEYYLLDCFTVSRVQPESHPLERQLITLISMTHDGGEGGRHRPSK